ncbi:GNAT family N-acetyltransferase [Fusibacter ferrireducens]|uniref:GNAT family N-acetyltransferase n=1 Tax=Fusibacter ferrireducens TaxID=2785058 RepID=A0ABR9ZUT4_9FIRM|nr:GNAT family N-acetyltransferase [Fusibacter ferrireducens]
MYCAIYTLLVIIKHYEGYVNRKCKDSILEIITFLKVAANLKYYVVGKYIHKLVIKLEFSGLWYAQKSISLIEEMARQAGVSYLRLDCYEDRLYLMNLYERCGFNKK